MNEDDVRLKAEAVGAALVAGDVDRVIEFLSPELRRNLGEVVALLPLPATAVKVESIERTGSGYAAIVEISHLSRAEREPAPELEGGPIGEGTEEAATLER